jgi:hypothetical protein
VGSTLCEEGPKPLLNGVDCGNSKGGTETPFGRFLFGIQKPFLFYGLKEKWVWPVSTLASFFGVQNHFFRRPKEMVLHTPLFSLKSKNRFSY